jgi:hypothetical protein
MCSALVNRSPADGWKSFLCASVMAPSTTASHSRLEQRVRLELHVPESALMFQGVASRLFTASFSHALVTRRRFILPAHSLLRRLTGPTLAASSTNPAIAASSSRPKWSPLSAPVVPSAVSYRQAPHSAASSSLLLPQSPPSPQIRTLSRVRLCPYLCILSNS